MSAAVPFTSVSLSHFLAINSLVMGQRPYGVLSHFAKQIVGLL